MRQGYGWLFILMGAVILVYFAAIGPIGDWIFASKNHDLQHVSLQDIDAIHVKTTSGNVQIRTEQRSDLKAELTGQGSHRYKLEINRSGSRLEVELKRKRSFWNFIQLDWFRGSARLELIVPRDFEHRLQLTASSGNITADGTSQMPFQLSEMSVKLTSGNIKIHHVQADHLALEGTSGNIHATDAKVGTADLKLTTGNIKMKEFQGAVNAKITSGNLDIQFAQLTGPIEARLTSGRAVLDLPDDAGFTLDAQVTSGKISNDFPLQNARIESNRKWSGTHGSGEHEIKLSATSGHITLK